MNPHSPDEAVLNRDARPGMMIFKAVLAIVFSGMSVGGFIAMWLSHKIEVTKRAARRERPDAPWTWNERWRDGVIKPQQGYAVIRMACFTVLWNAISWTIAIMVGMVGMAEKKPEWFIPLIVSLFPIIGVGLAITLLVMGVRWWPVRGSSFRMATMPGVIGGRLAGVVFIPWHVEPVDGFRLRLRCVGGSRNGEENTVHTLWENEKLIARTLDSGNSGETAVPVAFVIPSSAHETNDDRDIAWLLECSATLPGIDLLLSYEVPVFRTAESCDDERAEDDALLRSYNVTETLATSLAREGIRLEFGHHPGEVVFRSPPARHVGAASFLTIFSMIWVGLCVGFWWNAVWFYAVVFSLFAVVVVSITLSMWLSTWVLTIHDDHWTVRSGWWPLLGRTVEFNAADILAFEVTSSMSSGDTKWNNVQARLHGREKAVTLSGGLASRRVEQIWINDLKVRAGLTGSGPTVER